jgi:hypothetical protein
MKEILMNKETIRAQVDDDDYEWLSRFHWRFNGRYVVCESLYLHRMILGVATHKVKVDHADRDTLNNQKDNLRKCNTRLNLGNSRKTSKACSSRFKGVCRDGKKWQAYIRHRGKMRKLGYFSCEEDAARAYDKAAREVFGQFVRPNFPLDGEQGCLMKVTSLAV